MTVGVPRMAHDYLDKLGVPLKPLGEHAPPSLDDPVLRLHDSLSSGLWKAEKTLHQAGHELGLDMSRNVYSADNPKPEQEP